MNDGFGPGMFIGILAGAFFSFLITLAISTEGPGTDWQQFQAICAYEGGTVQGEVCLKNDKVIKAYDGE